MRFAAPFLFAIACAGPAPAQPPAQVAGLPGGQLASLTLPAPPRAPAAPLVLLLPDATGELGRSEPYVAALSRRGLASLVLGIEDEGEGSRASTAPRPGAEALEAAREWAESRMSLAASRIAVIGFGAGARVALTVTDAPVVALDPGCAGLALPPAPRPALLVHGLAAPDAADCATLDGTPGIERLPLPGIGHGWDVPVVVAPGAALLPDPSGPGRRRARPDPIATAAVAEAVAEWLAANLRADAP
jgi:dienelactone hydrolase